MVRDSTAEMRRADDRRHRGIEGCRRATTATHGGGGCRRATTTTHGGGLFNVGRPAADLLKMVRRARFQW